MRFLAIGRPGRVVWVVAALGAIAWAAHVGQAQQSPKSESAEKSSGVVVRFVDPKQAPTSTGTANKEPAVKEASPTPKTESPSPTPASSGGLSPVPKMIAPSPANDRPASSAAAPTTDKDAADKPAADKNAVRGIAANVPTTPAEEPLKPIAAAPTDGPVEVEAASFRGISPGVSPVADLEKGWGKAKDVRTAGKNTHYLYSVPPFERVEVVATAGKVTSIVIHFDKPLPVEPVAQQLDLARIRPVYVSSDLGEILGQSYPERGVLLVFEPSPERGKASMRALQIVLEPVTAEPFVLRGETNLESLPAASLRDLEQAVKLQPSNARAQWLRARLLATFAEHDKAVSAADEAVRLEPDNAQYHVTRAQALMQLGRWNEAKAAAEKAIPLADRRPHVKARAICLLGDLASSSASPDFKQAIDQHSKAIQLADSLAADPHPAIRIAAKEVLIDSHLGAAHDVAWGPWKEKDKAVPRWLDQAMALAEDFIKNEKGDESQRFRVYTRGLVACVGSRGAVDPTPYVDGAAREGKALIKAANDANRKAQLQWELGMAFYDALQVAQIRGQHDAAMKYGESAIENLEQTQKKRTPSSEYLLGRLYFRMGAAYALRDQNHRAAVTWFDKAIPLLNRPLPAEAASDLGRHGETFVSMGVSFWESGQRERAVELTQTGVELMQKAVKQNLMDESALSVAYGNLAAMHRSLGQTENAERFESMASQSRAKTQR